MLLEFGASGPLHVRRERIPWPSPARIRLLYASDLHLGHRWTEAVPARLREAAETARPDVILLGGDLADRVDALPALTAAVSALVDVAPVAAVPGNHDRRTGLAAVRQAVRDGGGTWLRDGPLESPTRIEGVLAAGPGPGPRVFCGHEPSVFPAAVAAGYDLALAGHLHGGQCVLCGRGGKQRPAVWLHRWHGLRFREGRSTMLVSRGAPDGFPPVRFNCPREVLLGELGSELE